MLAIVAILASLAAASPYSVPVTEEVVRAAGIPDEDWGYVEVRPGCHLFWWLYGKLGSSPEERMTEPIVQWHQGGPGASSTGFGNFEEIGVLDVNLQPRNSTWATEANLLFVDSPVGTGFSYVEKGASFATTNQEVANDLLAFWAYFSKHVYPSTAKQPLWIFSESYGGKVTSQTARTILDAVDGGNLELNLKGVELGDSWISGIDYVDAWGPFLKATSLMNSFELANYEKTSKACDAAVANGNWSEASKVWGEAENVIEEETDGVDFYNILKHNAPDDEASAATAAALTLEHGLQAPRATALGTAVGRQLASPSYARTLAGSTPMATPALELARARHLGRYHAESLSQLMNGPIAKKLNGKAGFSIPDGVTWGGQSGEVFSQLSVDFMKPSISQVESLLERGFPVHVLEGQIDLICCTTGAQLWMKKLTWSGMEGFYAQKKVPLYPSDTDPSARQTGAFVQSHSNLWLYYVLSAGHMAPADQPTMMHDILKRVLAGQ